MDVGCTARLTGSLPCPLPSVGNGRENQWQRAERVSVQRQIAGLLALKLKGEGLRLPFEITFTRVSARAIRDSDNLVAAFKSVRDAVAEVFGIDDCDLAGETRIVWMPPKQIVRPGVQTLVMEALLLEEPPR